MKAAYQSKFNELERVISSLEQANAQASLSNNELQSTNMELVSEKGAREEEILKMKEIIEQLESSLK